MPACRQMSLTGMPASACLRIETIWVSVKRDFFMEPPGCRMCQKALLLWCLPTGGAYVCTSHARCRHQQSALQHLGFGPARLFARFDLPVRLRTVCGESSWPRAGCVSAAPSTALVVLFASGVGLPHVGRRCQGTAA